MYIIDDNVSVGNSATLAIKPGCLGKFNTGYELRCGHGGEAGAIIAGGTTSRITLT